MILYDQDFRFIGMSAETLNFLGYENIDEFTSMHSDFSDLFIKKEGFIHKFDNFSWIHYVLYSGAANKKAYIARKDGQELCVNITIKEVFLNHTYDGLRIIYSVKLINENFTKVSQNNTHETHSSSPAKNHFSLNNLTKDLNLSDQPAAQNAVATSENATHKTETPDFKLDIPDESIFATPKTETSETRPQQPEIDIPLFDTPNVTTTVSDTNEKIKSEEEIFTLNFPESATANTEDNSSAINISDFGAPAVKEEESETTPSVQTTGQSLSEMLKLNAPAEEEPQDRSTPFNFNLSHTIEDTTEKQGIQPEAKKTDKSTPDNESPQKDIFSFQLLKEQYETPAETTQPVNDEKTASQPDKTLLKPDEPIKEAPVTENPTDFLNKKSTETPKEEKSQENIFNFNFLLDETTQNDSHEASANEVKHEKEVPLSELLKPNNTDDESTTQFSFNLFKNEDEEQSNESILSTPDEENKSTLIDQIKHDIEVIDRDVPNESSETEDPGQKLKSLLYPGIQEQESPQNPETTTGETVHTKPLTFDFQTEPEKVSNTPEEKIETAVKPEFPEKIPSYEENSFEETLKNIFSTEQKTPQHKTNFLNDIEPEKSIEETKQSITTEAIKSPEQNEASSSETLTLPQLGNLGLSREEELDFIEEFLDDTIANIELMQEYLKLEDYSNIKYNLIKIASSAEILHFDQMLAHTKALTTLCNEEQKDSVAEKLQKLLQLTKRYKAHFSTMPV